MRIKNNLLCALRWVHDHDRWLQIVAALATILSLFAAFYLFKAQLDSQARDQRQDKIAKVAALRFELDEIVWTIERYQGLRTNELGYIYHHFLPTENLREATRAGWLAGSDIGPDIIRLNQLITRENSQLSVENSPEYVLTQPGNWQERKIQAMERRQRQLPELKSYILALKAKLQVIENKMKAEK